MITTLYAKTTLWSGDPYATYQGDPNDSQRKGELQLSIAIAGNFIEISYNVFDNNGKVILGAVSTEIIPKEMAKLIMEMTNYGTST